MFTIKNILKAIVAVPLLVIVYIGTLAVLLSLGLLDKLYPNAQPGGNLLRSIVLFNTSNVDLKKTEKDSSFRIYR